MASEAPEQNPEIPKQVSDNDRKFITASIDYEFLRIHEATSYYLVTDWLETNDEDETKLVRKTYPDNTIELLHIAKVMVGNERKAIKTNVDEAKFQELRKPNMPHIEKVRYEFKLVQNDNEFKIKYDEFADNTLRVLEVDAIDEKTRKLFDPQLLPFKVTEVTGKEQYYGYRIAAVLSSSKIDEFRSQ